MGHNQTDPAWYGQYWNHETQKRNNYNCQTRNIVLIEIRCNNSLDIKLITKCAEVSVQLVLSVTTLGKLFCDHKSLFYRSFNFIVISEVKIIWCHIGVPYGYFIITTLIIKGIFWEVKVTRYDYMPFYMSSDERCIWIVYITFNQRVWN